jgi:hypothetical protein
MIIICIQESESVTARDKSMQTHAHFAESSAEPFEELQASLFILINRYASEPCCCLAAHITHQVEKLLRHPLIDLFPELQKRYAQSLGNWRARARQVPATEQTSVMLH